MCMVYKDNGTNFSEMLFQSRTNKKLSALAVNIFNSIQKLFDKGKIISMK